MRRRYVRQTPKQHLIALDFCTKKKAERDLNALQPLVATNRSQGVDLKVFIHCDTGCRGRCAHASAANVVSLWRSVRRSLNCSTFKWILSGCVCTELQLQDAAHFIAVFSNVYTTRRAEKRSRTVAVDLGFSFGTYLLRVFSFRHKRRCSLRWLWNTWNCTTHFSAPLHIAFLKRHAHSTAVWEPRGVKFINTSLSLFI